MKGTYNMIVTRYNFETNSSSMHSLSFRRTEGEYTEEDLKHSEAMAGTHNHDAIITLKEGHTVNEEEIRENGWIWNNKMRIWNSDLDLRNSAMQIMSSFREKLIYALSTLSGYRYRGWEKRSDEIQHVFAKYLPGVELEADYDKDEWPMRFTGTNEYLLYPFLKQNKITIEEFLTNTKYIVVVDYVEYQKMKWLNMVDESQIESVFHPSEYDTCEMKIENGVWKLSEGDLCFGRYPFRVLGTPEGKARYALAAHMSENIDEILEIMQEVYPEMKSIELPMDSYEKDVVVRGYCEDPAIPYNIPLREFILNKKYVIISDGDEYATFGKFKRTPLFNKDEYPEENINKTFWD